MGTISYEKFWLLLEGRLRNIFKHGFMSIAAVIIMIACLLLTGTVTLIAYNINLSIIDLQQSNEIVVFIDDSLTTRAKRGRSPRNSSGSTILRRSILRTAMRRWKSTASSLARMPISGGL